MKKCLSGTIDKIRFIGSFPKMMVRFSLIGTEQTINCLAVDALAEKIMVMDECKTNLLVHGHYNKRQQFIVDKMVVKNPTSYFKTYSQQVDFRYAQTKRYA